MYTEEQCPSSRKCGIARLAYFIYKYRALYTHYQWQKAEYTTTEYTFNCTSRLRSHMSFPYTDGTYNTPLLFPSDWRRTSFILGRSRAVDR